MKNKKALALMLAITMIMSVFASCPIIGTAAERDNTKYPQYTTDSGSVSIEAENVIIDKANVRADSAKDASVRKHIVFTSSDTTKPEATAPGMLGFDVKFDQEGKYYLWVRYTTAPNDSAWISYGGEVSYAQIGFTKTATKTEYEWRRIGYFKGAAGDTMKVRIRTREQNFIIDKFIVTKIASYTPEGKGELPDPETIGKPAKMPEGLYPIPTVTPPPEHPRVLFMASDIPQIKQNMEHPELVRLVEMFNNMKDTEYTGELPDKSANYDVKGLEIISAKALDYALYGNEDNGRQAIVAIKNYAESLDPSKDSTRHPGHVVRVLGVVYDWCYPLLTDDDKESMMYLAQMLSATMEVGFPPDAQTIICGHGAEAQLYRDWLSMSIACYDEYPDAYNLVAGKIFSDESVTFRNWWNQSGTHTQGSAYSLQQRYMAELYAHILIKRMSGVELFNEEDLVKIAYEWIYRRRPDGALMIDGDDNFPNGNAKEQYATDVNTIMFLASAISGDPILKREFLYSGGFVHTMNQVTALPIDRIILNDTSIDTNTAIGTLPLTRYFSSPMGEMVARTGWDMGVESNDVVATMTIGEYYGMNHAHYDSGHFMIYYKGPLANDSGWYEKHGSDQHKNYMSQTVAHNSLLIGTPYNKYGNQNQGITGQGVDSVSGTNFYWLDNTWKEYQANKQNHFADILGHEFGPDVQYPEYSYIAGDLADAYTSDYDDDVEEALRHMIFLPTGDEKNPAAFVVFDKIQTKTSGNKKSFLLHMEEEPEVSGNITTIKRTEGGYNGKLVNQTLLPATSNLSIEKIGGAEFDENGKVINETDKRFWNKDQNWSFMQDTGKATGSDAKRVVNKDNSLEAGWGRVEISPKKTNKVDYLLNVMYVGQADDNSAIKRAALIETDKFAGTKIFDRVVMFNKEKARTKDTVNFTVPGSESALKVNVAGLEAGTWSISVNGNEIGTQIASEDGGIIYVIAPAGSYSLTYVSTDANKQFEDSGAPKLEGVTILFNNSFLYSDVPPTIIDGRTLIPMRALLEAMHATVTWDEASATATANDGYTEIKITENQTTAYVDGEPVELDVPAMIINGRFVIPVRFIAENLGAEVSWNEFAKNVKIAQSKGQKSLGIENFIRIVDAKMSGYNDYEGYEIQASFDGDYSTYWSVQSGDQPSWGIYDFGKVKTLDKLLISYTQSNKRSYKFDIEVSEDGVNFTPLLTGMETSGTQPEGKFEEFDLKSANARYVRILENGNSTNKWNTLAEIVFTEKK